MESSQNRTNTKSSDTLQSETMEIGSLLQNCVVLDSMLILSYLICEIKK